MNDRTSGRILFFYTQFHGGTSDANPARIVRIHSDDGGRTWSQQPVVVVENVRLVAPVAWVTGGTQ
jgi:hypothetical protein